MDGTPSKIGAYEADQLANAAYIMAATFDFGLDVAAAKLAVACAMGESSLRNIGYGDWETGGVTNPDGSPTSSIGLFQQQAWWGSVAERMDPVYATREFLHGLVRVTGWRDLPPSHAINKVQINSDPEHYAKYVPAASEVVDGILTYQTTKAIASMGLYTLRPGLTLQWDAAVAWALAEKDLGYKLGVNRSLADWDTQYKLWQDYTSGRSPIIALHPNDSMHVKGLAVDSDNQSGHEVLTLAKHGFIRTVIRNGKLVEPWHYDYLPEKDQFRGAAMPAAAGSGATDFEPEEEEEIMNSLHVGLIINVVPTYSTQNKTVNGTLYIAKAGGGFEPYLVKPADPNVRGIVAKLQFEGDGSAESVKLLDKVTFDQRDFQTVDRLWYMANGKVDRNGNKTDK